MLKRYGSDLACCGLAAGWSSYSRNCRVQHRSNASAQHSCCRQSVLLVQSQVTLLSKPTHSRACHTAQLSRIALDGRELVVPGPGSVRVPPTHPSALSCWRWLSCPTVPPLASLCAPLGARSLLACEQFIATAKHVPKLQDIRQGGGPVSEVLSSRRRDGECMRGSVLIQDRLRHLLRLPSYPAPATLWDWLTQDRTCMASPTALQAAEWLLHSLAGQR